MDKNKIKVIGVDDDSTMKSELDKHDMSITNGLSNEVIFPIRNYHKVGTSDVIPILIKTDNYSDFNEKKHKQTCIKNRKERKRKKKHKR